MFSYLQESRTPSRVTVTCHNSEHPILPSASFSFLLLSMTSHGLEYSFGQLVSGVPAVPPPIFLCTLSTLSSGAV